MHDAPHAWHEAKRRQMTETERRHWHAVKWEITRRTGYSYHGDTATRMLER